MPGLESRSGKNLPLAPGRQDKTAVPGHAPEELPAPLALSGVRFPPALNSAKSPLAPGPDPPRQNVAFIQEIKIK